MSEIKCPFCGTQLESFDDNLFYCPNRLCKYGYRHELPKELWEMITTGLNVQNTLKGTNEKEEA